MHRSSVATCLLAGGFIGTLVIGFAGQARAADAAGGERIFKTQCGACHAVEAGKNRIGPSMFGIVGRPSGAVEGFRYSAANKSAALTWDTATLDRYLINPREMVPGTTMTYAGLRNEAQRADVVAYLDSLK